MTKAVVATLAFMTLLSACAVTSIGKKNITSLEMVSLVSPGIGKNEVQEILGGQPSHIEFLGNEEKPVWKYYYFDGSVFSFFGILNFVNGDIDSIAIVFDQGGKVEKVEGVPIKLKEKKRSLFKVKGE